AWEMRAAESIKVMAATRVWQMIRRYVRASGPATRGQPEVRAFSGAFVTDSRELPALHLEGAGSSRAAAGSGLTARRAGPAGSPRCEPGPPGNHSREAAARPPRSAGRRTCRTWRG